jgi:glycine/D-amino acid oxidase-like deaminating enzyme
VVRDPLLLCQFLLEKCRERGVQVHQPARAVRVMATDGNIAGVQIANTATNVTSDIPGTRIVVASGAWTPQVYRSLFPTSPVSLPISSLAGHSLLVKSPSWPVASTTTDECHALFSSDGVGFAPEFFSRVTGQIYLSGLNSFTLPLPNLPTDAELSEPAIADLKSTAKKLVKNGGDGTEVEVVRKALCFRPITDSGNPILTRIPDEKLGPGLSAQAGPSGGVFVAAGHGPWGISFSLGTGIVMAELIQGRQLSADISRLSL